MTNPAEDILSQVAENLDRRRLEMTKLRRVLLTHVGKPLEATVIRMCVPMVYAQWEGYVKEICQLYLEHVELSVTTAKQLQPALLGYLWIPKLKPITGGLNFERRKAVAECALTDVNHPIRFADAQKAINTRSNLNFSVLQEIAHDLCLDISRLAPRKRHLDTIVQIRNNIAHGVNPQSLRYTDFEKHAEAMMRLMEDFERVLLLAIESEAFRRPSAHGSGRHRARTGTKNA